MSVGAGPQRLAFIGPRFTLVLHLIRSLGTASTPPPSKHVYRAHRLLFFPSVISDNAVSWFDIFGLGIFISKIDILSKFDAYALV